jgi:exopolyphosphatase / guanosine-5'-triphosphate,3'-diphosphate pyrophosphatase
MSRKAIIDLGTNTCNLLIAESLADGEFVTLYEGKEVVKLGLGGIHKELLTSDAIERGLNALHKHALTINEHQVEDVKIFATSALRGAENRDTFLEAVWTKLGWKVEIIDGDREAELIFKGVNLSLSVDSETVLILDIGGGSNEFILSHGDNVLWKQSFNIGIARVLEIFTPSDPLLPEEITKMEQWFEDELAMLWQACENHRPDILVGCSGAFDTFTDLYEEVEPESNYRTASLLPVGAFQKIHETLKVSTLDERQRMRGMDPMRVEMIVVASVFVNFVLRKLDISRMYQSHFSLKEGAMHEIMSNKI